MAPAKRFQCRAPRLTFRAAVTRSEEWKERTEFVEGVDVDKPLFFADDQALSRKRYDMSLRMGQVQRVALRQNVGSLPFTNERLAASVGRSAEAFNTTPVRAEAADIVFDALAQSKSGLLPPTVCDERRAGWLTPDGGFDSDAFSAALAKAQALVLASTLILYVGVPVTAASLFAKAAHLI